MKIWYEAKTGNHQGLINDEETGRNVAVSYEKEDAALISAAPELLQACKNIYSILIEREQGNNDLENDLNQIEQAIAKAEGRDEG